MAGSTMAGAAFMGQSLDGLQHGSPHYCRLGSAGWGERGLGARALSLYLRLHNYIEDLSGKSHCLCAPHFPHQLVYCSLQNRGMVNMKMILSSSEEGKRYRAV